MKTSLKAASTLIALLTLSVTPARGQLSSYVDDRGNVVYTNVVYMKDSATPNKSLAEGPAKPSALRRNGSSQSVASALAAPSAATPQALHQIVRQTAEKHNVDPALISAVISTESNWNTSAISRKGAQGLMQLVPETAQKLGVGDAFDPAQNVDAGVRYLEMLLRRYNGDVSRALAAYNAGPGAVDRVGGVPNFRETRDYVRKVTSTYFRPGSDLQPPVAPKIYPATAADGRVVFTNE